MPHLVIFGSSVAAGAGASAGAAWADLLAERLPAWQVTNRGRGGDGSADLLVRYEADVHALRPDAVLISLSLANEGLLTGDPQAVVAGMLSHLRQLISRCRADGIRPILAGPYPHDALTAAQAEVLRSCNGAMSTWGLPFIDFLTALDDGAGHWPAGCAADAGHPNDAGHQRMAAAIDLNCFTPPVEAGVERLADQVYVSRDQRPLLADLYRPADRAGAVLPVFCWVHGGAWERGGKGETIGALRPLLDRGIAVLRFEYRFSHEAPMPAPLEDVRAALAWCRDQADRLGIDPTRMALGGSSAGGHLALLAGLSRPEDGLRALTSWAGPTDFPRFFADRGLPPPVDEETAVHRLLGLGLGELSEAAAADASPISYARGDAPPLFIEHGAIDDVVPLAQSERLVAAINARGGTVRLRVESGIGHNLYERPEACANLATFLAEQLGV